MKQNVKPFSLCVFRYGMLILIATIVAASLIFSIWPVPFKSVATVSSQSPKSLVNDQSRSASSSCARDTDATVTSNVDESSDDVPYTPSLIPSDNDATVMIPKIQQFFRDYQDYTTGGYVDGIRANKMRLNANEDIVDRLILPGKQDEYDDSSIVGTFTLIRAPIVIQSVHIKNCYTVEVDYTCTVNKNMSRHADVYKVSVANNKIATMYEKGTRVF